MEDKNNRFWGKKIYKKLKFCMHSCFQEYQPTNQKNLAKTYFFTFFDPFWQNFENKFEKNFVYDVQVQKSAISRPKSRQFPTVLETLGNYLFKSRILGQYLKKQPRYDFRKKKNCFGNFRVRNSTLFACRAKAQKLKKSNFGIF